MTPYTQYPGTPGTDPEQTPEQTPPTQQPEPERKRILQPVFSTARKLGFALTAAMVTTALTAQTPTPTPGSGSGTLEQQPTTQGWTMFDENIRTEMGFDAERLTRLREVDERYRARYVSLGKEPWMSEEYGGLTEQRNHDIEGILSPVQYTDWQRRYPIMNNGTGTRPGGSENQDGRQQNSTRPDGTQNKTDKGTGTAPPTP